MDVKLEPEGASRPGARVKRVLPPVSKASGGLLPGIDIADSRSLQESDDADYALRLMYPK